VRQFALEIAPQLNHPEFKASNGWIDRMSKRNALKMFKLHGEAESADSSSFEMNRPAITEIISKYSAKDTYNFDETALFYSAPPRTTIAATGFMGRKESKKRLTVGLLCNADGSDKWFEPLTIGHAKRPKCFDNLRGQKQEAAAHGFHLYFHNENAWMTKKIFKTFLQRFDRAMRYNQRKVLLILDNFAGHIIDHEPTNVELLFLPPNTTSVLQPLDGGIIRAFKAHFKRRQFSKAYRAVGLIQSGRPDLVGPIDQLFEIDQLQAMKWIRDAWDSISSETIKTCWDTTIYREFGVDVEGILFIIKTKQLI
jgi:hypothetical protein